MVLGHGLLDSDGAEHDRYRKMLNPLFTPSQIKSFVSIYVSQTRYACDSILSQAASTGQVVNLAHVFSDVTLRIIGLAAFGFNFEADPEAHWAYENAQIVLAPWVLIGTRILPGFLSMPIPSLLRRRQAQAILRQVVNKVIEHKLAGGNAEGPQDLLDLILPQSTSQEAIVHTMTFLGAGHETSTSALSWIFAALITHPAAAAKVRQEYNQVRTKFTSLKHWEAVNALKYTLAVIQESMRLNAVVAKVARRTCAHDDFVPMQEGPSIFVPAGTAIEINIAALNRHPKYWTSPDEFMPERFLEGTAAWNADLALRDGKSHAFYYIPFSAGSKNCIGQRFGLVEMQVIVATMIGQFDFRLTNQADLRAKYNGVTTFPAHLEVSVQFAKTISSA
ncbi:unnamed protein product [Aphanomyces euteiches]